MNVQHKQDTLADSATNQTAAFNSTTIITIRTKQSTY
jgi:hypothetical protein